MRQTTIEKATGPCLVSAVVLAAGLSSRMGGAHKLLLDAGGEPIIRRTVRAVLGIQPAEIVVVTGYREADITAALCNLAVRFCHNPDFAAGQPGSVAAGLRALTAPCQAVMIILGDQPLLTPEALNRLVMAYQAVPQGRSMLVPLCRGTRGNPVVIAAHLIPTILSGSLRLGNGKLIETYPDQIATVEMMDEAFIRDCDTPEDYAALRAALGLAPAPLA